MIEVSGVSFSGDNLFAPGSIESIIIRNMKESVTVYAYQSTDELMFEIELRKNIIASARAMDQSDMQFANFANSRCNPMYWDLTDAGGFQLKPNVLPSEAILDIYRNSSLYAFECAVANVIIYYHALLTSIGLQLFNELFQGLYLYSWHFDPDFGIRSLHSNHFLPGDVVYFNNPDFDPAASWWRGENAVVMGDGTFFGHGLGIMTADRMIESLNSMRKPGSTQSAYLANVVTSPSFRHLANLSLNMRGLQSRKIPYIVIHHNESSISCSQYLFYLNMAYNPAAFRNPF
ncbi:protein-glutamine gamma-glutamyltransferase [Oceanobacillus massiliensis]|uniref:protein-glutamine gamma-glutamyltransferase n=1 Tax=Oceanobacillus massiliensis TaxID=1465765 RepID=UPI0030182760